MYLWCHDQDEGSSSKDTMPTVIDCLFEQRLNRDCTELYDKLKPFSSSAVPNKLSFWSMYIKATNLFSKWQALSKLVWITYMYICFSNKHTWRVTSPCIVFKVSIFFVNFPMYNILCASAQGFTNVLMEECVHIGLYALLVEAKVKLVSWSCEWTKGHESKQFLFRVNC